MPPRFRRANLAARCGLLVVLLISAIATPFAAAAAESSTVNEELNLRSGPGASYRVIAVMPAGSTVSVTGEASEGWYPVQYNSLAGWAFGQYLSINGGAPVVATNGARGTATVVTNILNLRSGPGLSNSIVARLTYGMTVEIVGDPQAADGLDWVVVMTKSQQRGWVAGKYLDPGETSGATAGEAAPAPAPAAASSGNTIVDIITAAANRYGQNPAAMIAIARCESGLNPQAYNGRSGASGLFQFLPGTWRTTPFAGYSIFDPWASANAAAWMWSVGRRGEWVC